MSLAIFFNYHVLSFNPATWITNGMSFQIPAVRSTLRSSFFSFKNSNPQRYSCIISLANYKGNVTTKSNSKKSQRCFHHFFFFFWFLPKNIIPENLADIAGNLYKRKYNISLPRKHFSISNGKFCSTVHVVPIVDCMTFQNLLRPLKKLWHPFSQPSVQMNGDLPSTEAKNRVKEYFSMPQLGTRKGVILKSHLRHQGS